MIIRFALKEKYLGCFFYFICLLLFFTSSCDDNIDDSELSNEYFPIQLGNSWTFEETYYDTVQKHREVTYSITKSIIVDEVEYFAFDNWPEFIYFPLAHYFDIDSVFIRNDENGDVVMIVNSNKFTFIKFDSSLAGTGMDIVELFDEITQTKSIWQSAIYDANRVLETEHRKLTNGFRMVFLEFNSVGSQTDVFFFPGYGIVRMYYFAYARDWKLKEAIINGKKLEKIITYPNF